MADKKTKDETEILAAGVLAKHIVRTASDDASGNGFMHMNEIKKFATAPITLAFADVATETSAGNLIDGQLYNITGFPAFSSGIQLTDLRFRGHLNTPDGLVELSNFGTATEVDSTLEIGINVRWANNRVEKIVVPYYNVEINQAGDNATVNAITNLKWNDPARVYNSTINDFYITNFTPTTKTLTITNSFIQSGSSIDMAGFTGLVLDHVNLGFACDIIVTADSITCQDIRTGSNNTIYLPGNGINGGIWGSGNVIGGVSLGFSQFDNITMGNDNDITPDIDGIWAITSCEWGDGKTHVINSSFDGCFWIGNQSTFTYVSEMGTDVNAGTGTWTLPTGYGIILMKNVAPANISGFQNLTIPIHCKSFGTSYVFKNTGTITFATVPVNTAGALAVGSTVTSLTTGANVTDCFDVELDSNGTDTIIKNITLTP